jgi:hypothetical protein
LKEWVVVVQSGPEGPAAEPSRQAGLIELAETLMNRSFKTYKARLIACRRLDQRGNAWNTSLISAATATTVGSIGLLVNAHLYGRHGDVILAILAIVSLVESLVVSNVNYGSRARAMETNYKNIQQISVSFERLVKNPDSITPDRFLELEKEYATAIAFSENHTTADHAKAGGSGSRSSRIKDGLISAAPYVTLLIPIALLVPLVSWLFYGN